MAPRPAAPLEPGPRAPAATPGSVEPEGRRPGRRLVGLALLVSGIAAAAPAHAGSDTPTSGPSVVLPGARPVADPRLDQQRGGFVIEEGRVTLRFGVQESVYVNGQLQRTTAFDATAGLGTLQAGTGNRLTLDASGSAATLVQNSVAGQHIEVRRVIDVSVDSLQRLRFEGLHRSLVGGVVGSLQR